MRKQEASTSWLRTETLSKATTLRISASWNQTEKQSVRNVNKLAQHTDIEQGNDDLPCISELNAKNQSANGRRYLDCTVPPRDRTRLGHNHQQRPGKRETARIGEASMTMCSITSDPDTAYSARMDVYIIEFVALSFVASAPGNWFWIGTHSFWNTV